MEIETTRYRYIGSLIDEAAQDKEGGKFYVKVNAQLTTLFADGYTLNDWETRKALKHDLSKWLLGYIQSHEATNAKPHRINLERLRDLCGSETEELRFFRKDIRKAMAELASANVIKRWQVTESNTLEFARPEKQLKSAKK